jgi:hypothetical protein
MRFFDQDEAGRDEQGSLRHGGSPTSCWSRASTIHPQGSGTPRRTAPGIGKSQQHGTRASQWNLLDPDNTPCHFVPDDMEGESIIVAGKRGRGVA